VPEPKSEWKGVASSKLAGRKPVIPVTPFRSQKVRCQGHQAT